MAADHQNCPIGAHTHNIPQADGGKMLNEMLTMMAGLGYVKMEEVPQIPRWPRAPAAQFHQGRRPGLTSGQAEATA